MTPQQVLRARWEALASREKALVGTAGALLLAAIVWWLLLAPAIGTLRGAPAQHRELDEQLQRMLRLQAQAQSMQALPKQSYDEALRLLEVSIRDRLGATARYAVAGDRVTITLTGATSDAIAQWLTQARVNARALPGEARLARNAAGLWDGTLVLTLPPR